MLSPTPKLAVARKRTRKPESTAKLPSSPFKQALEQKEFVQNKGKSLWKRKARNVQPKWRRQQVSPGSSDDEEEWPCLVYGDNFRNSQSKEGWIQCQQCLGWAHDKCTEELPHLIYPNCESDYSC